MGGAVALAVGVNPVVGTLTCLTTGVFAAVTWASDNNKNPLKWLASYLLSVSVTFTSASLVGAPIALQTAFLLPLGSLSVITVLGATCLGVLNCR